MDELVHKSEVVDAALVKAVTALMPGASIDEILDCTRSVLLKRVYTFLRGRHHPTVVHLIDEIILKGLQETDAKQIMNFFIDDENVSLELKREISALLDSELMGSIFKFISELDKPDSNTRRSLWCCIRPKTSC